MRKCASHDRFFPAKIIGSEALYAEKKGEADTPRIMLAGHMDEIGFIVKFIMDEGFIKFRGAAKGERSVAVVEIAGRGAILKVGEKDWRI
jgi:hypothetical protein